MNSNINLYLFASAFGCHDDISDDLVLSIVEKSENKFRDILLLCPNAVLDKYTFEENIAYNRKFVKQLDKLFNMNLSGEVKELCAVFLLKYVSDSEAELLACENVINVNVNDVDWLFIIRDYVRYTLMGSYLRKGKDFERIKELTELVKEKHDIFAVAWKEMQNDVNALVHE